MAGLKSASSGPGWSWLVVCVLLRLAVAKTRALVLPGDIESYDFTMPSTASSDELERDLRSWHYRAEPDPFFAAPMDYFRSAYNLASLRPISATPPFTLDPSYISPSEVFPARAKRANGKRKGKREELKEQRKQKRSKKVDEYYMADDDTDLEDEPEEEHVAKMAKTPGEDVDIARDVEDYAQRYEEFIAKHFDGKLRPGRKSAAQRKAPRKNEEDGEDGEEEEEDSDEEEDEGKQGRDGEGSSSSSEEEPEKDGDYRIDFSSSDDYERIKAESEEQSRRLAADPRNCRTYEKDGMVCSVCHDPASDSASESCAFATDPHHRKYAYVKERNYDSKKPQRKEGGQEEQEEEQGEEEELSGESRRGSAERQTEAGDEEVDLDLRLSAPISSTTTTTTTTPANPRRRKVHPVGKPILRSKPHQLATNGGGYRYQPPASSSNRPGSNPMKLREEAKDEDANIYVLDYSQDQDEVARVLAEFKARDWSNCRKGKRAGGDGADGLTCYQCSDAAGVNHEECMYVAESRQVATGIALPPVPATGKRQEQQELGLMNAALVVDGDGPPAKEKHTVKRTVSIRSSVSGSGHNRVPKSVSPDASNERVIHYEHHVSHEVP